MIPLVAVASHLIITTTPGLFSAGNFWAIIGVALAAFGFGFPVWAHVRNKREKQESDDLSLYTNLVDDLQEELRRLQDQIREERRHHAFERRHLELELEKLEISLEASRLERRDD